MRHGVLGDNLVRTEDQCLGSMWGSGEALEGHEQFPFPLSLEATFTRLGASKPSRPSIRTSAACVTH